MSKERSVALYLQDMLESIEKIESYRVGVTADEFAANSLLQDAVSNIFQVRRLEVIGEAAKHVPQAVRAGYPDVPWRRISGLRDVLIREYFGVIVDRVWQVITIDMPAVKPRLLQVQADLDSAEREDSL